MKMETWETDGNCGREMWEERVRLPKKEQLKNLKVELRKRYFHVLQVILTLGQRQVIVPTLQRLHKNDKIIKYPVWASHSHFRVSGHYEFFD